MSASIRWGLLANAGMSPGLGPGAVSPCSLRVAGKSVTQGGSGDLNWISARRSMLR
jgi:hypothetical protein